MATTAAKTKKRSLRRQPTPERRQVPLGRIVGVFGLRGELKIAPTGVGEDALRGGLRVHVGVRELTVEGVRSHKHLLLTRFEGIGDANAAGELVGNDVVGYVDDVALRSGEYLDEDLIGCRLIQEGRTLGTVREIRHYPAQDILELSGGELVPLVAEFVREIDAGARVIQVRLPPGLIEGEPL